MNDKEFNKVDWINIIIHKRFQDYLNLNELQELSMMSKLTRSKLNPVLFKSIRLYTKHKRYGSMPTRTYNVESFEELSRITWRVKDEIEKSINIKNTIKNINSELQNIKHYVNGIFICDVNRLGSYIYQILINFANLSVLNIHCSIIQYSIFQKLGEYFPMLKTFELYYVALSKESTGNDNSNEIVFPFSLSCLSICCIEVTDLNISSGAYSDVIDKYEPEFRSNFTLPNISLPSLKKLQFLRCSAKDNGLEEFLDTNPNLEQLNIDNFSLGMSKSFNSPKRLELEHLDIYDYLQSITANNNIKSLKITIEGDYFYKFKKICLMCPSVEILRFDIIEDESYQKDYNAYLIPILNILPNLKTLELPIYLHCRGFELIDINYFPQIEKVIIETHEASKLEIFFEKNRNIKEIEFRGVHYDNKEEFLEKYKSYSEWRFKFFKRKVKGYKINNQLINYYNLIKR